MFKSNMKQAKKTASHPTVNRAARIKTTSSKVSGKTTALRKLAKRS